MHLRNVLLISSAVIIAFCLSLYFQSGEQNTGTMPWDQYKGLSYREERSHTLEELNTKIRPLQLEDVLQEITERNRPKGEKTRVMEIGPGNGRVLMTLKKKFPDVEFYGINKEKTRTFYRRESYALTALKFEIMSKTELEEIDLPYIVFADLDFGGQIPYGDNKFDLIYSQDTIKHIKYKFELFNEILRVPKVGGVSIHTDFVAVNIYSDGVIMETREAFLKMKKQGLDMSLLEGPSSVRFTKKEEGQTFPLTPHWPIPENTENISDELRRPEMSYTLSI